METIIKKYPCDLQMKFRWVHLQTQKYWGFAFAFFVVQSLGVIYLHRN